MLPSEFKEKWTELQSELLIETFGDFVDHPKQFVYAVQISMQVIRQECVKDIEQRVQQAINLFGIDQDSQDYFWSKINVILKEFWAVIFKPSKTTFENVKQDIKQLLNSQNFVPKLDSEAVEELVDSTELDEFIELAHKLCIYMILNEPLLECDMSATVGNFQFDKYTKDLYWVDGFPKPDIRVVTVMNPPKVNKQRHPYMSIQKSVLVDEDIEQKSDINPTEQEDKSSLEIEKNSDIFTLNQNEQGIPSTSDKGSDKLNESPSKRLPTKSGSVNLFESDLQQKLTELEAQYSEPECMHPKIDDLPEKSHNRRSLFK